MRGLRRWVSKMSSGLETQISPLLGLTLLEMAEVWTIMTAFGSIVVGGVIGGTFWWQRRKQSRIDSARLATELLAVLRTEDFRKCQVRIIEGASFATGKWKRWRVRYLGHFDTICGFHYYDKILTKRHMEELFGALIENLWLHEETRQYIYDKERERRYKPIKKWFEEEVKPHPL